MSLDKYRKKIDEIDQKLQSLLEERFALSKEVGLYKFKNNLSVLDLGREDEILKEISGKYRISIRKTYQMILKESRDFQNYDYLLVGKSLPYSFSPIIYRLLGIDHYQVFETDNFNEVLNYNFKGLNITNPYKHQAYHACRKVSDTARRSQSVNLILKTEQGLFGDNSDYHGFNLLLDYFKIDPKCQKVLIIGNGDSARLASLVLADKGADKVSFIVRNKRKKTETLLLDFDKFKDYDLIVNATPYGVYPNLVKAPLFPLDSFSNLKAVIDLIYNPALTPLLREAKKHHIPGYDGLYMLVSQAIYNASYFLNQKIEIGQLYQRLKFYRTNIVLIGMPFSGKTRLGKTLSKALDKEYIDIDQKLKEKGLDIDSLYPKKGLLAFRKAEAQETILYSQGWNQVISCGGGIILNDEAMAFLQTNGLILFLDIKIDTLLSRLDDSRPLIKNKEDLIQTYQERYLIYQKYADIIIKEEDKISEIVVKINEYLSD